MVLALCALALIHTAGVLLQAWPSSISPVRKRVMSTMPVAIAEQSLFAVFALCGLHIFKLIMPHV